MTAIRFASGINTPVVETDSLVVPGPAPSSGQVLTSDGSGGVGWVDPDVTEAELAAAESGQQLYVQSRNGLITNGSGLLGNNFNFSGFSFDPVETHGGGGSFRVSTSQTIYSDEYLAVDPLQKYWAEVWGKSGNVDGSVFNPLNRQYIGVAVYDIDKQLISPHHFMKWAGSTDTTLAAPINPGDLVVELVDGTGWSTNAAVHTRQLIWFGYTNGKGYTYPDYTYTRFGTRSHVNYTTNGAWATTGISGNTITLTEPWPASLGTVAAGTAVSNTSSGGTFKYIMLGGTAVPNVWTKYTGFLDGLDTARNNHTNLLPYGTAFIRLLFLTNYQDATPNNIRYSDIKMTRFSDIAGVLNASNLRFPQPVTGSMMFDTNLGKPIWFNGASWVDANGVAV